MYVSVGTEIALFRHARGWSTHEYARRLRVPQPTIYLSEARKHFPSDSLISAYAALARRSRSQLVAAHSLDRIFAEITAAPMACDLLASAAVSQIDRVLTALKDLGVREPDLTVESLFALQTAAEKNLEALLSSRSLAQAWWFIAEYILQRLDLIVVTPKEEIPFKDFATALAAARLTPDAYIVVRSARDRADLARLCFSALEATLGPGGTWLLRLQGLNHNVYACTVSPPADTPAAGGRR